jgi:hypothetical protein
MLNKVRTMLYAVALVPCASARADTRPLPFHVVIGDWHVVAITQDGPGGTRPVHSVLALRDKSAAIGDNIVSVWYRPEADGTWSAKAWESGDQWKAIEAVKSEAVIGDQYDYRWPTADLKYPDVEPELPKGYQLGVLTTDPLFNIIIESPSRPDLVAFLAEIGYKAASVPIEDQTFICSTDAFLTQIAASIVAAQSDPAADGTASVLNFGVQFQAHVGEACAGPQTPPTPPVVSVPWTPGTGWWWDSCPGADYNPATGNCDYGAGFYWQCQYRVRTISVPVIKWGLPPTITWVTVPYVDKCCAVWETWGFSEPSPDGTCPSCPRTAPPNPGPAQDITCLPFDW